MGDGMSHGRDYGPSLSKHGAPIISRDGKPLPVERRYCIKCGKIPKTGAHVYACLGPGDAANPAPFIDEEVS